MQPSGILYKNKNSLIKKISSISNLKIEIKLTNDDVKNIINNNLIDNNVKKIYLNNLISKQL